MRASLNHRGCDLDAGLSARIIRHMSLLCHVYNCLIFVHMHNICAAATGGERLRLKQVVEKAP